MTRSYSRISSISGNFWKKMLKKFIHLFFPNFSILFQKKRWKYFFFKFFFKKCFSKNWMFFKKKQTLWRFVTARQCVFYIGPCIIAQINMFWRSNYILSPTEVVLCQLQPREYFWSDFGHWRLKSTFKTIIFGLSNLIPFGPKENS